MEPPWQSFLSMRKVNKTSKQSKLMKIRGSTQRFDCLCLSINIWYWTCKTLYNCFVPGRQERSQVPRISGHAEMVCNFTLTDIQFDSSWKLGWLGEENIAYTGWFPNCASPFSVPKWKRGGAIKKRQRGPIKTNLFTRICGGKMYFVFFLWPEWNCQVTDFAFSPHDDGVIASGSQDGTVKVV